MRSKAISRGYWEKEPILVENQTGIFYGLIEELDEKAGTAKLKDAYKLPNYGYITFMDKPCLDEEEFDSFEELETIPVPSITDLAIQGIYAIWTNDLLVNTSAYCKAPIMFVSGISAAVPIANDKEVRESFLHVSPFEREDEDKDEK